jgi:hypothetical protein
MNSSCLMGFRFENRVAAAPLSDGRSKNALTK